MARDTYTTEQLAAIETMKHPGLKLGAARAEFVNRVLLPNGKVSKDLNAMRNAITNALAAAVKAEDYRGAAVVRDKAVELEDHIAQKRFLFVMGDDEQPLIYFQCYVDGNPDNPEEAPAEETP